MTLNVLLAIYAGLILVDMVFMFAMHYQDNRKGHYKTAGFVWIGMLLAFVFDGVVADRFNGVHHLFGISLIGITMFALAKLTQEIYRIRFPLRPMIPVTLGAWSVAAVSTLVFNVPFEISSLIMCAGITYPGFVAAYHLIRSGKMRGMVDRLFCFVLVAQSLHVLDYPFLRNVEGAAVYGFSLGLLLVHIASMLIPILINRRLSADLNAVLEVKVEQRTSQLLEAQQQLINSAKMSTLGEMAGGIAHEINTPLSVISMRAEQLQECLADGDFRLKEFGENLEVIKKTTDRIAKIVAGLRFFAREGQRAAPQNARIEVLIEETLSFCRERFANHGVQIEVEKNATFATLAIVCQPVEISQVLLNLLNNSFDAVSAVTDKRIKISVADLGDEVEISVTDSGPGILAQVQEKMMQPFFTTKEIGKGTGLGLSIAKGIVEAHNGQLYFDKKSAKTRFVFRLPINRQEQNHRAAA